MENSKNNRSTWRQVRFIVLLPLAVFLWVTGWIRVHQQTPKRKQTKEDIVHNKF